MELQRRIGPISLDVLLGRGLIDNSFSDLVDHAALSRQSTTVAALRNVIERFGLSVDPDQVSRRWMKLEQAQGQALAFSPEGTWRSRW